MSTNDFSFKNSLILKYFTDPNAKYVPSAELIYIHTHPLVTPNFLNEIQELINTTTLEFNNKRLTGIPVEKLTDSAIELGQALVKVDSTTAPNILRILRDIYVYCHKALDTLK